MSCPDHNTPVTLSLQLSFIVSLAVCLLSTAHPHAARQTRSKIDRFDFYGARQAVSLGHDPLDITILDLAITGSKRRQTQRRWWMASTTLPRNLSIMASELVHRRSCSLTGLG